MKSPYKLALCAAVASMTVGATDLGKYQLILDRELLGSREEAPPDPVIPTPPPAVVPSWASNYVMTMMSKDDTGFRVGLQHRRNNQVLLIFEEDPDSAYTLISADPVTGKATVSFRNQPHQFALERGPAPRPQPETAQPQPPVSRSTRSMARSLRSSSRPDAGEETTSSRRFGSREELQAHLREQQLDAIRTGKPPLPIPVTDEMVDQLIQEGWKPER